MINFHSFIKFLNRNKVYTAINVFGLAVSLMFVVLIFIYAYQEFSTDSFHQDKDRICVEFENVAGKSGTGDGLPIAYWLQERFPDIEEICPVVTRQFHSFLVRCQEKEWMAKMSCTESNFFTFFSFPLKVGSPQTVLQDEYSAVISETFARRVFGSEDPIGRSIRLSDSTSVTVTGVMYDISRSMIPYADLLVRVERAEEFNPAIAKDWAGNAGACVTFLKMYPGKDMNAHRDEVLEMFNERYWIYQLGFATDVSWIPLKDAYWEAYGTYSLTEVGEKRFVQVLFAVGLLILFFAIFNYINLTVAQIGSRAKEMATRRLLGSSRGGIMFRLVVEAVLLTAFSYLLGLLLVKAVAPVAGNLLHTTLDLDILLKPASLLLSIGFILFIGLLAGILPAVLISAAKPVEVVRGSFRRRSKMVFSKYFIIFQNAITVVMIAVSLVMVVQVRHMMRAPLGYNTLNVIDISMHVPNMRVMADKLSSLPSVKRVGTAYGTPFNGGNNMSGSYCGRQLSVQWLHMDTTAFNILGLKILNDRGGSRPVRNEGRYYDFYLTEYSLKEMGLDWDADELDMDESGKIQISGVLADFHRGNILFREQPFVVGITDDLIGDPWDILVEVQGDPVTAYEEVVKMAKEVSGRDVEAQYIDLAVRESFDSERRMMQIVGIFTCMAILISVLGLVAISIYFIRQRAQEMAVRKVFGSDNSAVLFRLVRSFLSYVLIGFVIACPVVWYLAEKWLSDYSYRISFNPLYIVAAGLFCLLVSFVAVYFQSRRAARTNPIESLRTV